MKVSSARFVLSKAINFEGYAVNRNEIALGYGCSNEYGGGVVSDLEVSAPLQSLIVRKTVDGKPAKFFNPKTPAKPPFDAILIPLHTIRSMTAFDDEAKAQPVQQQAAQRR